MPGCMEAQAYDAGLLAQDALDAGARSRAAVLQTLQNARPDRRCDRAAHTSRRTGLQRQLFLLQVYDGKVQEVSDGTS